MNLRFVASKNVKSVVYFKAKQNTVNSVCLVQPFMRDTILDANFWAQPIGACRVSIERPVADEI